MACRLYPTFLLFGLFSACSDPGQPAPAPSTTNSKVNKGQTISVNVDKSPMDMAYYPVEYPKLKMARNPTEPLMARVIYSRPKKDGRQVFGHVITYGAPWRLGANEATEIEFFRDVKIQNTIVKKDRYVIYCIPFPDKWRIKLNNDLFTWGLKIDSTKDVHTFEIPVQRMEYPYELFTMEFQKAQNMVNLVMAWDTIRASLPMQPYIPE